MENMSFNISGKIESIYLEAIGKFKKIADAEKIPFMLVGATVRDFIMEHVFATTAPRKTRDVDVGINIASWEQYEGLSATLIKSKEFTKGREEQSFIFKELSIDIIPFGRIVCEKEEISWPSIEDTILKVMGYQDVYENSICLVLSDEPHLKVRTPTVAGLVLLKIFSWKFGFPNRRRDATDLAFLIPNYQYTDSGERLYRGELPILEKYDFDIEKASIYLLGKDIAMICSAKTLKELMKILNAETADSSRFDLTSQMITAFDDFDAILDNLKILADGAQAI
jgi:predicted nucleotidyltransferase